MDKKTEKVLSVIFDKSERMDYLINILEKFRKTNNFDILYESNSFKEFMENEVNIRLMYSKSECYRKFKDLLLYENSIKKESRIITNTIINYFKSDTINNTINNILNFIIVIFGDNIRYEGQYSNKPLKCFENILKDFISYLNEELKESFYDSYFNIFSDLLKNNNSFNEYISRKFNMLGTIDFLLAINEFNSYTNNSIIEILEFTIKHFLLIIITPDYRLNTYENKVIEKLINENEIILDIISNTYYSLIIDSKKPDQHIFDVVDKFMKNMYINIENPLLFKLINSKLLDKFGNCNEYTNVKKRIFNNILEFEKLYEE